MYTKLSRYIQQQEAPEIKITHSKNELADLFHLPCSTGLQELGFGTLQGPTVACKLHKNAAISNN